MSLLVEALNNNKYLWALTMLGINVGGRAIVVDIGTMHPTLFDTTAAKAVVAFCLFFMASRDVAVAAVMCVLFFVVVFGLANPGFRFNLLPSWYRGDEGFSARGLDEYRARRQHHERSGLLLQAPEALALRAEV